MHKKICATKELHIYLQPIGVISKRINNETRCFRGYSDPTRHAIIVLIALQAMTRNAIAGHLDSTRQAVSQHLRILCGCKLVTQKQEDREIYYQLELNKMKEIDSTKSGKADLINRIPHLKNFKIKNNENSNSFRLRCG